MYYYKEGKGANVKLVIPNGLYHLKSITKDISSPQVMRATGIGIFISKQCGCKI